MPAHETTTAAGHVQVGRRAARSTARRRRRAPRRRGPRRRGEHDQARPRDFRPGQPGVTDRAEQARICSPISRNTTFSSRNCTVRQLTFSAMREPADCSTGALWPRIRPVTTTASTPEAWISSAGRNATYGAANDSVVSSTGSSMQRRILASTNAATSRRAGPAAGRADEVPADVPRTHRRGQRGDRGVQRDQRRRVVDQALALEDRHDPPRHADPPGDRRGGDRVRWRDDRADREAGGERSAGQRPPRDQADSDRANATSADRQQQDRAPVGPEVDQRGADRGRVEQRRQQPDQHEIGREVDLEERAG